MKPNKTLIEDKPTIQEEFVWKLEIRRVANGYILTGKNDYDRSEEFIIEEDEGDELKIHERLLQEVMEYFGFGGSKHDKERIRIIREKRK